MLTQEDICRVVVDPNFTIVESYEVDWDRVIAEELSIVVIQEEIAL